MNKRYLLYLFLFVILAIGAAILLFRTEKSVEAETEPEIEVVEPPFSELEGKSWEEVENIQNMTRNNTPRKGTEVLQGKEFEKSKAIHISCNSIETNLMFS